MGPLSKSLLLFTLNWLDGQLTLLWIRMNVATEGNAIMAGLLEQAGYRCVTAIDGEHGLRPLERERPGVVLTASRCRGSTAWRS